MVTLDYSSESVSEEHSITQWTQHLTNLNRNGPIGSKTNRIFCWWHMLQRVLPKWKDQNRFVDGSVPPRNDIAFLA